MNRKKEIALLKKFLSRLSNDDIEILLELAIEKERENITIH